MHGDGISWEIGLAVASASGCEDAGMAHASWIDLGLR